MARLTLSPNGLKSPLDLSTAPRVAVVEPVAPTLDPGTAADAPTETFAVVPELDTPGPAADAEDAADAPSATAESVIDPVVVADATEATDAGPAPADAGAPSERSTDATDELPAWATSLDPAALQPERLLGRPKQTALILDRALSTRADELVAATGPRVTFAALVIAVLHFHLPADGAAAAKVIGGYRRRKLESLDHPWEERNARLPEPLRAELDDVVTGAVGRVAAVRRSTLVNALLDAHLPATPEDAARLVTRMEMVRGGAFLA